MRIIDLSIPIETNKKLCIKVKRYSHRFVAFLLWLSFGLRGKHLKSGLGWSYEIITFGSCSTTHLEAPWHYAPTSEGKPSRTIDQIPLEWCYRPGVLLDMRHIDDGKEITQQDVKQALFKINYTLTPLDIVLIQTGNDQYLNTPEYFSMGSGMSAEATRWILDQGVKITGIDSCVWDIPLTQLAKKAKILNKNGIFWEAHYVGLEREWFCLERLTNLNQLPPFGFNVSCFPLNVKNGSAGPTRAVAILT